MFTVAFALWRFALGGSNRGRTLGWMSAAVVLAALSNLPLVSAIRRQAPSRPPISAEQFSAEGWAEAYRLTNSEMGINALTDKALAVHEALQVPINSTSLANLVGAGFGPNPLESTPGSFALALGLFGLIAAGRRAWGWAAIGGGFTLLTLGPFLQVDATPPIPAWSAQWSLPYLHFYNHIPFFSMAYRPYRLVVVVLLCLAAIAALGRVVNQISTINSIEKVTYNRCQAAYEQGLASLAAMQGEDGLFGTADDCTDAERSLVSAFILYLLAGDPAFRMTIRFAELMNWFDERANQLDPMIIALWTLAGLDRRNSAPTIQAA